MKKLISLALTLIVIACGGIPRGPAIKDGSDASVPKKNAGATPQTTKSLPPDPELERKRKESKELIAQVATKPPAITPGSPKPSAPPVMVGIKVEVTQPAALRTDAGARLVVADVRLTAVGKGYEVKYLSLTAVKNAGCLYEKKGKKDTVDLGAKLQLYSGETVIADGLYSPSEGKMTFALSPVISLVAEAPTDLTVRTAEALPASETRRCTPWTLSLHRFSVPAYLDPSAVPVLVETPAPTTAPTPVIAAPKPSVSLIESGWEEVVLEVTTEQPYKKNEDGDLVIGHAILTNPQASPMQVRSLFLAASGCTNLPPVKGKFAYKKGDAITVMGEYSAALGEDGFYFLLAQPQTVEPGAQIFIGLTTPDASSCSDLKLAAKSSKVSSAAMF